MKNYSKYFVEANIAGEKFAGVDGFSNMAAPSFGGDSSNVSANSTPYEIEVENTNTTATSAYLFDSFNSRNASNFNNPSGITITSTVDNVSYGALLAQTENKNFECAQTYIEVVSGSDAGISARWSLTQGDASGVFTTVPHSPKKSENSQQDNVMLDKYVFRINGFTKITIRIPAATVIRYTFYPSATVDAGRMLNNVAPMIGYADPRVEKPQVLQLDQNSLSALTSK